MHDELDPAFRQRHPDCAVPKHLTELAARVPAVGAAMGVAFDGDGDRLAVIDDRGRYVPAEKVAMLLVDGPLAVRPGDIVVLDIKASMQLERAVARRGGIAVRMKSGHAYMKRAVIERGAVLGSEVSDASSSAHWPASTTRCSPRSTLARWQAAGEVPLSARIDALPAFHLSPDLRLSALPTPRSTRCSPRCRRAFPMPRVERIDGCASSGRTAGCSRDIRSPRPPARCASRARTRRRWRRSGPASSAAYPALAPALDAAAAKS